jgi:UDP-2-acetamido-2,6-beta-L-arabino-hexul-4-ose reductase
MRTVLVTGWKGFIGQNLLQMLSRIDDIVILRFDVDDDIAALHKALSVADFIFHCAGINRPKNEDEFTEGNVNLTKTMLQMLGELQRTPAILLTSSTQAEHNNPYGVSKRQAEELLIAYHERTGAPVHIYRLTNVFGKWCRPHYNSVVATFCHSIARNKEIEISDVNKEVLLVYIDDVVHRFIESYKTNEREPHSLYEQVEPIYKVTLGDLANKIYSFRNMRTSLELPDFSDPFARCLYATYLSYLQPDDFAYPLIQKKDARGELAELIKSSPIGQIFVSRTRPGITRGDHFHDTKVEKFIVVEGDAIIRFRLISNEVSGHPQSVIEIPVSGKDFVVVDIPPGYTHSIENIGMHDLVVLFWSDEIFMPQCPDTYPARVKEGTNPL